MSEKITAPFTKEQVENLNHYQQTTHFHSFTCCGGDGSPNCKRHQAYEKRRKGEIVEFTDETEGILKATKEGWVCPCGEYTQNWAHGFMAEPYAEKKLDLEILNYDIPKLIEKEPISFFLVNTLKFLTSEQRSALVIALNERLPDSLRLATQFPTAYHTVDIIPYYIGTNNKVQILLGQKTKDNGLWCHIGGFVDPEKDNSAEEAALRELGEETLIKITDTSRLNYVGSIKVNDERFINSRHKIITSIFTIRLNEEEAAKAKGGDDIANVASFNIQDLKDEYKNILVSKHHKVFERFLSLS